VNVSALLTAADWVSNAFSWHSSAIASQSLAGSPRFWRSCFSRQFSWVSDQFIDGGDLPEVGKFEPGDEPPAFALDCLAINEEADPLLEHEGSNGGLLPLFFERFGHADETEGDQPIVCGRKHVSFLCFLFARIFLRAPPLAGLPRGHAIIRELLSGSSHAHGYWRAARIFLIDILIIAIDRPRCSQRLPIY
jgi:hypothetical protein